MCFMLCVLVSEPISMHFLRAKVMPAVYYGQHQKGLDEECTTPDTERDNGICFQQDK